MSRARRTHAALLVTAVVALWPLAAEAKLDPEGWTTVRTANFVIYSNAEKERAVEIARRLERFRAAFSELAPELELRSPVPTRILAFRDRESYAPFKSGRDSDRAKILGQFLGHRDGNFITLNADRRFLDGFGVVLHEYVHYFVEHNLPGVPRWFNEGLAEYYSTFTADNKVAIVGRPVERHLQWFRTNDELDLAGVFGEAGRPAAGHRHRGDAGRFYAVSWALVHYLFSSGEEGAASLSEFLDLTGRGEPPVAAFEQAFDLGLTDLEDRLEEYFLGPNLPAARLPLERLGATGAVEVRPTTPGDLMKLLGNLVLNQGQERRAETFFNLALDYEPEHADAHAGLAHVRDLGGRLGEAEVLFERAIELGPREALSYLRYGRHLLLRMQEARVKNEVGEAQRFAALAKQAFQAAAEGDPEFAEAQSMFGYAHLFAPGDPRGGVAPLARARELMPGRPDVVFHLIQLNLKLGEFSRARSLTEDALARIGDEEMLFKAREEIERAELIRAANSAIKQGDTEQGLRFLDEAIDVTTDPEIRDRLVADLERLQRHTSER